MPIVAPTLRSAPADLKVSATGCLPGSSPALRRRSEHSPGLRESCFPWQGGIFLRNIHPAREGRGMLGRKISAYQIVDTLGSGSLGVTYRARNLNLERDAVLKVLPDAITQDPQRFERARSEIRAAAGLNHPNIAAIYEMFREDNQWFIILELLQGQTLQEMLAESTFDAPRVSESTRAPLSFAWYFEYAQHLLKAIEYGHAQGLVHQGLKPANIFITSPWESSRSWILDSAGLPVSASPSSASDGPMNAGATAPTLEGGSSPTKAEPHRYAGWAAYRSPEQVRGEKSMSAPTCSVWGRNLYEMATGRPPFAGESRCCGPCRGS